MKVSPTRLRFVAALNPGVPDTLRADVETNLTFLPMEAIGEDGSLDLTRERPIGEVLTGYSYFEDGDIAFAKVTPCFENGKAAIMTGLTGGAGFGTTEVVVVRPKNGVDTRFLFYVLVEDRFKQVGIAEMQGAGGLKRVPDRVVRDFSFGLPSHDVQKQIATFLDRETAEIDAFIADQEELIGLLVERRKSAHAAVLARADGARHVRLRFLFAQARTDNSIDSEVLSVYRDYGVIPKSSRSDNFNKTPEDVSRYLKVEPGYLVVNKMKAWQGSLGVSQYEGIVSPDYDVLRPTSGDLVPEFAHAYLRAPKMISEYALRSVGIRPSQWRLYWEQLRDLEIPLPSANQQDEIVRSLDHETAELDAAIADAREAISLSRERRAALISAAVTGKIDVREHGSEG